MAVLTWRNVDAPDFTPVMRANEQFTNMLGNAAASIDKGIAGYNKAQNRIADSAVADRIMKYQNPEDYKAAMASGELTAGIEQGRVSPETYRYMNERLGQLQQSESNVLQQAATRQQMDIRGYNHDQTQQLNSANNAAGQAVLETMQAYSSNDPAQIEEAKRKHSGVLSALQPKDLAQYAKDAQSLLTSTLDNKTKAAAISKIEANDEDRKTALRDSDIVIRSSLNVDDARERLSQLDQSPTVRALTQAAVEARFGPLFGPIDAAAPAGKVGGKAPVSAPGTAGTRSGSPFDVTHGFKKTKDPITTMTIGDVRDEQKRMIKDTGSSPMGAFQIVRGTIGQYAPKVLGEDWKTQAFTPENQDKIAEAIFNDKKDGNLKATWDALPNAEPGFYKDMPWSEARKLIAKQEVGGDISNYVSNALVQNDRMLTTGKNGAVANFTADGKDTAETGVMTNKFIKEQVPGADYESVFQALSDIKNAGKGTINDAQAYRILSNNLEHMGMADWGGNNLGPDIRPAKRAIDVAIQQHISGATGRQAIQNEETDAVNSQIRDAEAAYKASAATFAQVVKRTNSGQPEASDKVDRYAEDAKQKKEALLALLKQSGERANNAMSAQVAKAQPDASSVPLPTEAPTPEQPTAASAPQPTRQDAYDAATTQIDTLTQSLEKAIAEGESKEKISTLRANLNFYKNMIKS